MSINGIEEFVRDRNHERYDLFAQQGNEPSASDIESFEALVGFTFPNDFREFAVHPLGGLYVEAKEEIWPSAKVFDVGPFWSFLRGVMVYSLSKGAPEWLQMHAAWRELKEAGYPELVPFLKILGDADPYCFTKNGRIVIWRHEEPDDPEQIDMTFSEVVLHEIAELEERVERKVRGEDKRTGGAV
jgi:hypothetical protein